MAKKALFSGILTAFLLVVALHTPVQSAFWSRFSASAPDWQRNRPLMDDTSTLARKLVLWLTVTAATPDSSAPPSVRTMMNFIKDNPDWPSLYVFRKQIESAVKDAPLDDRDIIAWFKIYPPRTADAFNADMAALARAGETAQEKKVLEKFWTTATLTRPQTMGIALRDKSLFTPAAQHNRLEYLLWHDRFTEAAYMLPLVSRSDGALAKARMALGHLSGNASSLVRRIPRAERKDPGLIFARLRWRRMTNHNTSAFLLLRQEPKNPPYPGKWWHERSILARRALEKHDFSRAFDLINDSKALSGGRYVTKEWTLGWLDLDFLHRPRTAYLHFEKLYNAAHSAVSCARGAYWMARAAAAMGWTATASRWLKVAAEYPSVFYGQLAHEKIKGPVDASRFRVKPVLPAATHAFDADERVRAIRLLTRDGLAKYAGPFFYKLLAEAETRADFALIAHLADETHRPKFAILANLHLQLLIGDFMYVEGYPLLPPQADLQADAALMNAVVHRESMFDVSAKSPAGAQGLMQLMPGTARQVARRIGKRYSRAALTEDPQYNLALGAAYLQQLLDDYNGFYPLAIAAYNAGPRNVNTWIQEFGDPRSRNVNLIDWIEEIPIYETRNYIQRVMETYYMYRLRLGQPPLTLLGFKE